jgi:hypothetical protein
MQPILPVAWTQPMLLAKLGLENCKGGMHSIAVILQLGQIGLRMDLRDRQ